MGFLEFLMSSFMIVSIGEGLNCYFPYHDGEMDNEGMICQWEHESFYYDKNEDKWVLLPIDYDDNWVEAMCRERYWRKKNVAE